MGDVGGLSFDSEQGLRRQRAARQVPGIELDGVENTDTGNQSGTSTVPHMETVAGIKVQTSNDSAEYGTGGASNILVITRSGTKESPRAAYEFLRTTRWMRGTFRRHEAHAALQQLRSPPGRPGQRPGNFYNKDRDKTFFWAQEWRKKRNPSISGATPTDATRTVISSRGHSYRQPIVDPDTKAPFASNQIPCRG